MSHSSPPGKLLLILILALAAIVSAGPTLIALARAAVPLVIAVGVVAAVLRVVWWLTSRL